MEFWIAFFVTFIIGSVFKIGKRQNQSTKPKNPSFANKTKAATEHQQRLKESDELISVILPTITNDK